ncbi:NADH-quinone oxidoreductase subunit N, partial [Kibdelosporangium lantanae]
MSGVLVLAQPAGPISSPEIDYVAILPVLILLGAACVGVLFEAFLPKYNRWGAQVALSLLAVVVAGVLGFVYASDS